MPEPHPKIVVIIPCRYGSSRFAGKPLHPICGVSMIERVYGRALQARGVDKVVVATDDSRIAEAVSAFGGKVMMTSIEAKSGTDRVAEAAERLGLGAADTVVNVQGDQPLLDPRNVEAVARPVSLEPGIGMATLAFRIVDEREITDPKDVKVVVDRSGFALYFSRSTIPFVRDPGQTFPIYKHLGLYAYRRDFLDVFCRLPEGELERAEKLEQLRVLEWGHRIRVVTTEIDSPEVDLPEDIPRIEARLRQEIET
ncbi:MAG: 3-deoxy-manno-octulosonate cytidylyltransferase [Desulfobacterales bacterium]|nr:3-deoxy-manno-octulosonate cytidylyltransferase [Desulfobacterales bacterium]